MGRYLPLVFKNTWRSRRRTILTVLSIAVSLCLLGVLMALYYSFYFAAEPIPEQALRLWTRNRVSLGLPLPASYQQRIAQVAGVRDVMIGQWFGGVYKDARDPKNFFARFAVEPEKLFKFYTEYKIPEDQKRAFVAERTACVIGRALADRLGFRLGDRITLVGDIFPVTLQLTVRGIYDAVRDNENLFFHWKYLSESLGAGRRDYVATFAILADSPQSVDRIAAAVDGMFRNAAYQTRTETERAFELSFLAFLGNVKAFLLSICGAITFTILLVSANTMSMSVRERVREVGILKTLGFTPRSILGIILGEAVLIALAGGILGLALAELLCYLIRQGPTIVADVKMLTVQPPVAAAALGIAVLIGVISALVPAWTSSRRPIVEALRFTD